MPQAASGNPGGSGPSHGSPPLRTCNTPFVKVPRSIGFVNRHPWRERWCAFAIFSLPPSAAFWVWFFAAVLPHIPAKFHGLVYAMPISSLWITFGPLLMQQGEFNLERLLSAFNKAGEQEGWKFSDIQSGIDRADRIYYWVTIPLGIGAAAALFFAFHALAPIIALHSVPERVVGLFVVADIGFVSASGIWGVFMAISVVREATKNAKVAWQPFRSDVPETISQLYSFVWSVAVIFSVGSVFLPGLLVIHSKIPPVAGAIVLVFVVLLFIGGFLLFSIPQFMLFRMAQKQRDRALDTLAPLIERSISQFGTINQDGPFRVIGFCYSVSTILRLRSAIAEQSPAPLFSTLARASTTLALPVLLTLIPVVAGLLAKK